MGRTSSTTHPGIFHDMHLLLPFDDKWCKEYYFLKIKNTASTRQRKPTRWFQRRASFFITSSTMTVKTVSETTSWITFNSQIENGPPYSLLPRRFAGTIKQYSKKATSQLIKITATKPMRSNLLLNITCPYHAKVINKFEHIKSPTAESPRVIIIFSIYLYFGCESIKNLPNCEQNYRKIDTFAP